MHQTLLLTALMGLLDPRSLGPELTASAAAEGSAARPAQPAPPSAADSIVAAAFSPGIGTPAEADKAQAQAPASPGWSSFVAPALALLGLAGLAVGLTRRRRASAGSIRILEAATLGPRRSLVIADVLGDRLVLGVSEAGVAVLSSRPVPADGAQRDELGATLAASFHARAPAVPAMGFFARLAGKTPPVPFEEALGESIEDQELRAKLANGMRGVVP
jgi:flagellar biogenesis protein FliO